MNRIDNTKVMTALKSKIGSIVNIIIRKKVVTPQVVAPKNTNFIPKILITIVMGIGLGVGIHHHCSLNHDGYGLFFVMQPVQSYRFLPIVLQLFFRSIFILPCRR
jgi:hypothetical protein